MLYRGIGGHHIEMNRICRFLDENLLLKVYKHIIWYKKIQFGRKYAI